MLMLLYNAGQGKETGDTRINYDRVSAMPVVQMYQQMERSYNGDEIYSELIGKDKRRVRADAFAQYIMLYE